MAGSNTVLTRRKGFFYLNSAAGMRRRTLLWGLAAGGTAALAGCTGAGSGEDGGSNGSKTTTTTATATETDTATSTPTQTETTTTASPSVIGTSFELGVVDCGTGRNNATVIVDGSTVSIDGVIRGSDGCTRARLGSVRYAGEALTVPIESYRESGPCKQCIVNVNYTTTVRMSDPPERIIVTHDGGTVQATAARE